MEINVPNRKELIGSPVPGGTYHCKVTSMKPAMSSNNNPMIEVELTIQSQGPDPEVKTQGRKLFDRPVIMEKSLWRHNKMTEACSGQSLPEGAATVESLTQFTIEACLNKDVNITCVSRDHQGRQVTDVKDWTPYTPV